MVHASRPGDKVPGVAVVGARESPYSPIRIGGDALIRSRQAIPTPVPATPVLTPIARIAVSNPSVRVATADTVR